MFDRYWGFIVACSIVAGGVFTLLFMVVFVGLNYCPGEPCTYTRGEHGGPTEYEYWVPFGVGPNTTSHFEPPDSSGHKEYYERQDLRAQESAARAAISMSRVGFFTFVISILGAGFLFWNLVQTRQGNEISSSAAFAQTRAWLSCELQLTNQRIVEGEIGIRWSAVAKCANRGLSPALEVKFFAEIGLQLGGLALEEKMEEFARSRLGSQGYGEAIFPDCEEDYGHELMLMFDDIDKALMHQEFKAIFPVVYGCLNYRVPGSNIVHQTVFGYHLVNVRDGKAFLPMPSRQDWLHNPIVISKPGIVRAT